MRKDIRNFCKIMRDGVDGTDLVIKHDRKNELIRCDTGEVVAIFDKKLNEKSEIVFKLAGNYWAMVPVFRATIGAC